MKDLIDREIFAVAFRRDSVEFHFTGAILRSRADTQVAIGDAVYCFPKPGSRDALCLVIGATVRSMDLDDSRHLEFTTSNGCRVRLPREQVGCCTSGQTGCSRSDETC